MAGRKELALDETRILSPRPMPVWTGISTGYCISGTSLRGHEQMSVHPR